jgi:tRNA-binding protein
MISYDDFRKVDMRVGRVISVEDFPKAHNPSYRFEVDFGKEVGVKRSAAQLTNYAKEELMGQQVIAVVNFPPKNIAGFSSEVLILGVDMKGGVVSMLQPRDEAIIGARVY